MPGGDRTGPAGAGAMTGRGAGFCTGNSVPGFMNGAFGMGTRGGGGFGRGRGFAGFGGRGMGRGMGRGYFGGAAGGFGYPVNVPAVNEKEALNSQAEVLQRELDAVKDRLSSMDES